MTIKLATVTATLLLSVLPALTQPALTIDCENPTFASHERLGLPHDRIRGLETIVAGNLVHGALGQRCARHAG